MSTSGSTDFTLTRNELIAQTLTELGVYRPGATVSTADYNFCSTTLNLIIKRLESKGIHSWSYEEGALFLTEGQNKYSLSASTTDKVGKNPIQTNLTADCSGTTVTVTSTIGMTAADNIGLALDANTLYWTTIVSVDSTTQVTITGAPTSTASSGNSVYTYTTAAGRPLYIKAARLQTQGGIERPIEILGRTEFMNQPNKQTDGIINSINYSPKVSTGDLYVWMVPSDVNECIRFSYVRSIQDFDSSTDTPDLPQEWYDALVLILKARVAKAYGKDNNAQRELDADAQRVVLELESFDFEEGSTRFVSRERFDD